MKTEIRKLDGLSIEETRLDEEGRRLRCALSDFIMQEYEETGSLTGDLIREEVETYEKRIVSHVSDD